LGLQFGAISQPMTNDTFDVVQAVRLCVEKAWKGDKSGSGYAYTKAGVMLDDLIKEELAPQLFFAFEKPRDARLMAALDAVNDRFGKKRIVVGTEGFRRPFETKAEMRSPRYTTRLSDVPVVRV
jgi:DNA polymerase V